jgi:hypothetical protein
MRKLKIGGIAVALLLTVVVVWTAHGRHVQRQIDAGIVADIHDLVEQRLAGLKADDPIIRRYGAFKRWERGDWTRPHYLWMLVSRLDTTGIAHFEQADADVSVHITNGPKAVDFRIFPTDDWLEEQPDKRRLVVSGRKLYSEHDSGRGICQIDAWACHPDFVPD